MPADLPLPADAPNVVALGTGAAEVRLALEQPTPGTAIHLPGSLVGHGWALTASPLRAIDVELDGQSLGNAAIGLSRNNVPDRYAASPDGARSGFAFVVPVPLRPAGPALLRLIVRTDAGTETHAVPLEVVAPLTHEQAALEPIRLALEDARIDEARHLHVRGWAVAARGVRDVEVFLGHETLGFASAARSRADVAEAFPAYPDSLLSGFEMSVPLPPALIRPQRVTVVVTDAAGIALSAAAPVSGHVDPPPVVPPAPEPDPEPEPEPTLAPLLVMLEETRIDELGFLTVRGWAVGLAAVEQVRVFLDDEMLGVAAHNLPREDVGEAHPDYPNARMAGFLMQLDVPDEQLAGRTLRVVVAAFGNIQREATGVVGVAPVIRRRDREVPAIHFHCDALSLTEDGALYLKGWAVCPSGTKAIDVDLAEEALGQAELGGERADVGNHFPLLPGARTSGFRFLGRSASRREGEQMVRVTVRGRDGESRVVLLPVLARPEDMAARANAAMADGDGIRFFLDTPTVANGRATEPVRGFLTINGWAFSQAGIAGIEVFVDGRSHGHAYVGIRREDLTKRFGQKEALRAGFAMLVPPQALKKGHHDLRVVIRDGAGQTEEVAFAIEAEPSMDGPGPWSPRTKITQAETELGLSILAAAGPLPAWTILLPPGGPPAAQAVAVKATLESLRAQGLGDWTAVLPVADKPERAAWQAEIADFADDLGARLRLVVAGAETPLADLARAAPGLIAVVTPGDVLGEDALLELSLLGATDQPADFVYSDERRVDPTDGAVRAFFKPDWSPDLLLSTNYIGRLWAAAPDLLARAGVTLGELARHGDYDLVLRLTERAQRIGHVPKVLCARAASARDAATEERRALQRAVGRRGISAEVEPGAIAGTWRVRRAPMTEPLVSIIMPTNGARGLIETAIGSIRARTRYRNFEIVGVDNIAPGDSRKKWLAEHADAVVAMTERFNWSRFNNAGAAAARGEVLLFLNDDVEIVTEDWLEALLEHAQRPEVGAVGPQLVYPDGKVQHAGMFLGRGIGRHAFRYLARDDPGPFGLALTQRNVIAVTGACLMVRRDVFAELGGFDEEHDVINNDLDFCLRLRATGRVVVYTPHATLIHHEMASRAAITDGHNSGRFQAAWRELFLLGDPYFNPNLSLDYDDYVPQEEPVVALRIGHPLIARTEVRRILAVKLDHIGDFVSAFPAFRRLKELFPNAELTVLAAEASVELAALEPAIDRVLRFDFFHARSDKGRRALGKKDFQALREQLAPFRFDLALDLRRQPETRVILRHSGARWLGGFETSERMPWLDIGVTWEGDNPRTHKRTHISEALVQFVDAVAAACETDHRPLLDPTRSGRARAALAAWPAASALGLGNRPLVCVHAGAGSENKEWPLASFAALIDLLVARDDANVIVIGGPSEAATVSRLLALTRERDRAMSLAGACGLAQLVDVLAACDLYVGNDSGPKHMAASLGVPTVGIHSGTVDAVEWGPLGPAAIAVRRATTCSPCYLANLSDCHRGLACLTGIGVGDVYRQCRRLLALSGGARSRGTIALAAARP